MSFKYIYRYIYIYIYIKTTLRSIRVHVYTSAMTFTLYLNEISIDSAFPDKINQLETSITN